jgi:hypothetical protein
MAQPFIKENRLTPTGCRLCDALVFGKINLEIKTACAACWLFRCLCWASELDAKNYCKSLPVAASRLKIVG